MTKKEYQTNYNIAHKKERLLRYKKWAQENKEYKNRKLTEWRHKKGLSKKYSYKYVGIIPLAQKTESPKTESSKNKSYFRKKYLVNGKKKLWNKTRSSLQRNGGVLSIKTIQQVYEDNIKKYGTLTCYLCLNLIEFGKDSLEHKIPISRGGNSQYDNLEISCRRCNSKKQNKTVEEYFSYLGKDKR